MFALLLLSRICWNVLLPKAKKIIKNILKYLQQKSKSRVACYAIANWTLFSFPQHLLILQHFKTNCYRQPGAVWKKSKEAKNAVLHFIAFTCSNERLSLIKEHESNIATTAAAQNIKKNWNLVKINHVKTCTQLTKNEKRKLKFTKKIYMKSRRIINLT